MPDFEFLIVGGGMAANAAVQGIRSLDPSGSLGLLSSEPDPPYKRPPLSKGLWKGKSLDSIWLGSPDQRVELHLGRTALELDPAAKLVRDDQGTEYRYAKLLLATGGTPRRLARDGDSVIYFREVADYRRLRALADTAERFVVIGGGFIGSELAAALAMVGRRVTMIFPDVGIGARQFPAQLSTFLNDYYRGKGVEVLAGETIDRVERAAGSIQAHTQSGKTLPAEAVVAGLGILPNTKLAEEGGLDTDDGILVNPSLQTSDPAIYAAGDVARFHNPALDRRMRVEHEDNSVTMGGLAGKSMAGAEVRYDHQPYFYSDLFELGYEAVGILDPRLEVVEDWIEPLKKGVIYYLEAGRVRGVLLWDTWGQVEAARSLIAAPGPFSASDLRGRIRSE
ncbi:MAG TPA: FAD-dependent oxidoreductase [Anaerolineales bacterium]